MIVIVCGLPGSGKSVLVERLAKHYKLKKIFASGILKQLKGNVKAADKVDAEKTEKSTGWWETEEGQKFNLERLENREMDKALDSKLIGIVDKEDNLIIDSRTMPWLSKKEGLIKIWISASTNVRAQRVAQRDKSDWKKVLQAMEQRLEIDKKIYKKLYKIDFSEDLKPFQIRLDTTKMGEGEVFQHVAQKIDILTGKAKPEPVKAVEEEKPVHVADKEKQEIKEEKIQESEERKEEPIEEKKEETEEAEETETTEETTEEETEGNEEQAETSEETAEEESGKEKAE